MGYSLLCLTLISFTAHAVGSLPKPVAATIKKQAEEPQQPVVVTLNIANNQDAPAQNSTTQASVQNVQSPQVIVVHLVEEKKELPILIKIGCLALCAVSSISVMMRK